MPTTIVKSYEDLVTKREATCEGFLSQVRIKVRKAMQYVAEAKHFKEALQDQQDFADVIKSEELRQSLISVAGVSEKALKYLTEQQINEIFEEILHELEQDKQTNLADELVYRYLLTRGASFDGHMRNYVGAEAARTFAAALLDLLQSRVYTPLTWFTHDNSPYLMPEAKELLKERKVQKIVWKNRIIFFDKKPRLINKSVDAILTEAPDSETDDSELLLQPESYLACGELKGGIDPAGADEHWKTAKSALDRIEQVFRNEGRAPRLFFVAAAIETDMAREIFQLLEQDYLARAANLTVPEQLSELVSWLVSL